VPPLVIVDLAPVLEENPGSTMLLNTSRAKSSSRALLLKLST